MAGLPGFAAGGLEREWKGMFLETLITPCVIPQWRQAPSSASILPTTPLALETEPFSKMGSRNGLGDV